MKDILYDLIIKEKIEMKEKSDFSLLEYEVDIEIDKNPNNLLVIGPVGSGKMTQSLLPQIYKDIQTEEGVLLLTDDKDLITRTAGIAVMENKEFHYWDFNSGNTYIDIFSIEQNQLNELLNVLFHHFYRKHKLKRQTFSQSLNLLKKSVMFLDNTDEISFENIQKLLLNEDYFNELVENIYMKKELLRNHSTISFFKNYYKDEELKENTLSTHLFLKEIIEDEIYSNVLIAKGRTNLLEECNKGLFVFNIEKLCEENENQQDYHTLLKVFILSFLVKYHYEGYPVYIEELNKVASNVYISQLIYLGNKYNYSLRLFTESIQDIEQIDDTMYDNLKRSNINVGIYPSIYKKDEGYLKELINKQVDINRIVFADFGQMTYVIDDTIYIVENKCLPSDKIKKMNELGSAILRDLQ